jgi:hypothetical protein
VAGKTTAVDNGCYWVLVKGQEEDGWLPARVLNQVVDVVGTWAWLRTADVDIGPRIPQYVPDDKSKTAEYPPVELDITVDEG